MHRRMRCDLQVRIDMKKLAVFALGFLLASPASARDINETLDADPKGSVEIYNTAGSVTIEGWSRKAVEVTGTLGNEVEEFIFERDGDDIIVKVKPKRGTSGGRGYVSDIVVRVPQGSSIDVATVSADIDVKGVHGEQELQSVSGEVDAEVHAVALEVETVSGDIDVQGNNKDSETELATVSGDISAKQLSGEVDMESVNGDLTLVGGSFTEANFETVNGRIEYEANLRKGGELDIETVNGRVDVNFVGSVSADFEIETFNGRIKNCFGPKAEKVSKYAPGWELSFTEGNGDGSVSISTLNGGVNLCKE